MIWKDYSRLKNTHAFCGGSNYRWRNYDLEKLEQARISSFAAPIGTALHEYAAENIRHKIKVQKNDKHGLARYLIIEKKIPPKALVNLGEQFLNLYNYVNDCIDFNLDPEVTLYFSEHCYGFADAISWQDGVLQISDLKTGTSPASFMQLENYACFFCLDYKIKPKEINKIIFRLYQCGEITVAEPPSDILVPIIDQLIEFNRYLNWFSSEVN